MLSWPLLLQILQKQMRFCFSTILRNCRFSPTCCNTHSFVLWSLLETRNIFLCTHISNTFILFSSAWFILRNRKCLLVKWELKRTLHSTYLGHFWCPGRYHASEMALLTWLTVSNLFLTCGFIRNLCSKIFVQFDLFEPLIAHINVNIYLSWRLPIELINDAGESAISIFHNLCCKIWREKQQIAANNFICENYRTIVLISHK